MAHLGMVHGRLAWYTGASVAMLPWRGRQRQEHFGVPATHRTLSVVAAKKKRQKGSVDSTTLANFLDTVEETLKEISLLFNEYGGVDLSKEQKFTEAVRKHLGAPVDSVHVPYDITDHSGNVILHLDGVVRHRGGTAIVEVLSCLATEEEYEEGVMLLRVIADKAASDVCAGLLSKPLQLYLGSPVMPEKIQRQALEAGYSVVAPDGLSHRVIEPSTGDALGGRM